MFFINSLPLYTGYMHYLELQIVVLFKEIQLYLSKPDPV